MAVVWLHDYNSCMSMRRDPDFSYSCMYLSKSRWLIGQGVRVMCGCPGGALGSVMYVIMTM